MTMKFRAHETFFIRKGWISKGMKAIHNDPNAFISKERNPMDTLGIGSNMVQEMRKNVGSYNLIFNAIPKIYGAETVNRELAEKVRMTKNYFDGALECLKNELSEKMRNMFCTLDTAACEKMSLPSIIRDWCEKLDQAAFEQLFTDGTDRCLALFRDVTNDEDAFIAKAAKMATDLRLEDWDEDVISMFSGNMEQYRNTAESFHRTEETVSAAEITEDYELTYKDENGKAVTKRFAKVEESRRGKLLYNALDAYEKKIQPAAKAALFISSYTPASHDTEIKVRGLLESRYSMMQGTISGEINDLLTNWM